MARRAPERGDMKYYKYDMVLDPDQVQHELQLDVYLPWISEFCSLYLQSDSKHLIGFLSRTSSSGRVTAIKKMMVLICKQTFDKCAKSRREFETTNGITDPFQHYELDFHQREAHVSTSAGYVRNLYCDITLSSPRITEHIRRSRMQTFGIANEFEHTYMLSVKYQTRDERGSPLFKVLDQRFIYEGIDTLDIQLCDEHKIRQLTKQQHDSEMQFGRQEHTETNPEDIGGGAAGGGAAGACIVSQLQNPYCLDKN